MFPSVNWAKHVALTSISYDKTISSSQSLLLWFAAHRLLYVNWNVFEEEQCWNAFGWHDVDSWRFLSKYHDCSKGHEVDSTLSNQTTGSYIFLHVCNWIIAYVGWFCPSRYKHFFFVRGKFTFIGWARGAGSFANFLCLSRSVNIQLLNVCVMSVSILSVH